MVIDPAPADSSPRPIYLGSNPTSPTSMDCHGNTLGFELIRDIGHIRVALEQLRQRQSEIVESVDLERQRRESLERDVIPAMKGLQNEHHSLRRALDEVTRSMSDVRRSLQPLEETQKTFERLYKDIHEKLDANSESVRKVASDQVDRQLQTLREEMDVRFSKVWSAHDHLRGELGLHSKFLESFSLKNNARAADPLSRETDYTTNVSRKGTTAIVLDRVDEAHSGSSLGSTAITSTPAMTTLSQQSPSQGVLGQLDVTRPIHVETYTIREMTSDSDATLQWRSDCPARAESLQAAMAAQDGSVVVEVGAHSNVGSNGLAHVRIVRSEDHDQSSLIAPLSWLPPNAQKEKSSGSYRVGAPNVSASEGNLISPERGNRSVPVPVLESGVWARPKLSNASNALLSGEFPREGSVQKAARLLGTPCYPSTHCSTVPDSKLYPGQVAMRAVPGQTWLG